MRDPEKGGVSSEHYVAEMIFPQGPGPGPDPMSVWNPAAIVGSEMGTMLVSRVAMNTENGIMARMMFWFPGPCISGTIRIYADRQIITCQLRPGGSYSV